MLKDKTIFVSLKKAPIQKSRTEQLEAIAKKLGFEFHPSKKMKFNNFGIINGNKNQIQWEENILVKTINDLFFQVSDLSVIEGMDLKPITHNITVLSITNINLGIPIFLLEKERKSSMLKKIVVSLTKTKNNSDSISTYSVKGLNAIQLKDFFNEDLISLIKITSSYTIESLGCELIIYTPERLATPSEIIELIRFGRNFIELVKNNK